MADRGILHLLRRAQPAGTSAQRSDPTGRERAFALLPALLSVPVPIVDAAGELLPLRAALDEGRCVALAGPPGSGRSLVMRQYAQYRARVRGGRPVDSVGLAQLDARASADALPAGGDRLLLVHGWEDLGPPQRALWREALIAAAQSGARLCVALPAAEPDWPGFTHLSIIPPPPPLISRWVAQLAPAAHRAAIEAALAPGAPLAPCAERLAEIALLAWVTPRHGLPANRAHLYELALRDAGEELHPQARRFGQARRLAAQPEDLAFLAAPDLVEVAALAALQVSDPRRILTALWGLRERDDAAVALGRGLWECPSAGPLWTLRGCAALGRVVAGGGAHAGEARRLLDSMQPRLDAALADVARRRGGRLLSVALRALPADLALPRLEALVFDDSLSEDVAWRLADVLAGRAADVGAPRPSSRRALARWVFVQALCGPVGRRRLAGDPALLTTLADAEPSMQRIARVGAALADDSACTDEVRLAVIALIGQSDDPDARSILQHLATHASGPTRRGAVEELARGEPSSAEAALRQAAQDIELRWDVRLDSLLLLAGQSPDAEKLLADAAHDESLPLYARVRAVHALARSWRAGALLRIAADAGQPEGLRSAALTGMAETPETWPALAVLLGRYGVGSPLSLAICRGLGGVTGGEQRGAAQLADVLRQILGSAETDPALSCAAALAIGRVGGERFVPQLAALLGSEALERLLRSVPHPLADQPAAACLADPGLPTGLRAALADTLARSLTPADQPTTLREFLVAEANKVRAAAAQALAAVGGERAAAALRAALGAESATSATAAAADALADVAGVRELIGQLARHDVGGGVRWQIIERLALRRDAAQAIEERLAEGGGDSFTRGGLVEALGRLHSRSSLALLCRLADDPHGDGHVRAQAIVALGELGDPAVGGVLLTIASDPRASDRLRGLAAEHLPMPLTIEQRRVLRDMVRGEIAPPLLTAGVLRALGRARDREAIALPLRYALDDRPEVVRAAIDALASMGDETVTPVLVRLAQRPGAETSTRLQAIGALLRLGGREHQALLQPYLTHGTLLVQLRALDQLIAADPPAEELAAMIAGRGGALAIRLRLIDQVAGAPAATRALAAVVTDPREAPQARRQAAIALGASGDPHAVKPLAAALGAADSDDALRLRCIEALARLGGTAAWEALSETAEGRTVGGRPQAWACAAIGA